jgi:hypothetical protein
MNTIRVVNIRNIEIGQLQLPEDELNKIKNGTVFVVYKSHRDDEVVLQVVEADTISTDG